MWSDFWLGMRDWFYKIDLDGDGLTDLVVNGLKFVVVMDRGHKGFRVETLGRSSLMDGGLQLLAIDSVGAWKGLEVWDVTHKRRDTLVCHLGWFCEYNAHPLGRLDSNYIVPWTDDETVSLEVRYNGRVKRISDYGAQGTLGLRWLYGLLYALRDKVDWENP